MTGGIVFLMLFLPLNPTGLAWERLAFSWEKGFRAELEAHLPSQLGTFQTELSREMWQQVLGEGSRRATRTPSLSLVWGYFLACLSED
jgi:hypothetical protein